MTPAALSHQIRGLEDLLALKLFHRRARAIELTAAARLIYPGIRTGFESLRAAVEQLDRARQDRILVVSASPGLTAKWLVPRIYRFLAQHPDIDTRISSSIGYCQLHHRRRRRRHPPELGRASRSPRREALGRVDAAAVQPAPAGGRAPAALAARSAALPADPDRSAGAGADLGRLAERRRASTGIDTTRGLRLNVADHALDAASEGTGVVLGYKLVASHDIGLGRLVSPFGPELPLPGRSYHFVCAKGQEKRPDDQGLPRLAVRGDRGHLRQARLRCAAERRSPRPRHPQASRRTRARGNRHPSEGAQRRRRRAEASDCRHPRRRHRPGGDRGRRRGAGGLRQARRRLRGRLRSLRLGLGALQEDRRVHARERPRR